jgi:hypothetical protein
MSHVDRKRQHDLAVVTAQAAQLVQRQTCEGCAGLPRTPRPMCITEASPHYRLPRHTGSDACGAYAVRGHQVTKTAAPELAPASRAAIAGEVAKRKHNRWAGGASA